MNLCERHLTAENFESDDCPLCKLDQALGDARQMKAAWDAACNDLGTQGVELGNVRADRDEWKATAMNMNEEKSSLLLRLHSIESERDELKRLLEMWDAGHELVPGPTEELVAENSRLGNELFERSSRLDQALKDEQMLLGTITELETESQTLESRLGHYQRALENIRRLGSDGYGIINESAKAADWAINATEADFVVERNEARSRLGEFAKLVRDMLEMSGITDAAQVMPGSPADRARKLLSDVPVERRDPICPKCGSAQSVHPLPDCV